MEKRENKTYSIKSDSNLFSHGRVAENCLFFGEEFKQYLTFSVEISTNTLITQYSKHLWSDEQEHAQKLLNHFMIVEKVIERLLSY